MTREDIEKLPLRPTPVLDRWNSIVSKRDEKPAFVYVVLYCSDTGEMALISVPKNGDTTTTNGMTFSSGPKRVWVYGMKTRIKIDDPKRRCMKHWRVLQVHSTKNMILCAFSTPERAIQCLSRWVETNGERDLDQ